jgi:hypothetical protein
MMLLPLAAPPGAPLECGLLNLNIKGANEPSLFTGLFVSGRATARHIDAVAVGGVALMLMCASLSLQVSAEDYLAAKPDPVAKFSGPVCKHMNEDHADAIAAIVQNYAGITVRHDGTAHEFLL